VLEPAMELREAAFLLLIGWIVAARLLGRSPLPPAQGLPQAGEATIYRTTGG